MTNPSPSIELGVPGVLRVALAVSSAGGAFWSSPGANGGDPTGVSVDLGRGLAAYLGVQPKLVIYPNSNAITEAAAGSEWDVTFIPYDAERAERLDFGPVYNQTESTFLMRAGSPVLSIEEIDRGDQRILAVAKTTTSRALAAWLREVQPIEVQTIDEIEALLAAGEADAFAMSRDSLLRMSANLPGSRVLEGRFFAASTAVATPKDRPVLLDAASQFLRKAMENGTLRAILDAHDMAGAEIPAS
jgi:polar amino acid transport system substrate-binding protein